MATPALADGARAIERALASAFASGEVRPREFGGTSGTADIVRAVMEPAVGTMSERIVMVGAGYWAQFQVEGWRDAGAPVVAMCNRTANAEALAERFGVPALLHRPAQTCSTPIGRRWSTWCCRRWCRRRAVRAALERGIPTICQKPFGVDLRAGRGHDRPGRVAGVPLVVHENFRFAPWFRECRRLIDAGFFGRLHGITFRLRPGDGQGPRAYLDRQPYFQPMPLFLVRETAVHFIDTFRFLMGEVVAVTARLRRLNPVIAGEDSGLLIFEFDDDAHRACSTATG